MLHTFENNAEKAMENPIESNQGVVMHIPSIALAETISSSNDKVVIAKAMIATPTQMSTKKVG